MKNKNWKISFLVEILNDLTFTQIPIIYPNEIIIICDFCIEFVNEITLLYLLSNLVIFLWLLFNQQNTKRWEPLEYRITVLPCIYTDWISIINYIRYISLTNSH